MQTMINNVADAFELLLEKERECLLVGDFKKLESMHLEKETLLEKLGQLPEMPVDQMERLATKTARNQALLTSAMDGLNAIKERLKEVKRTKRSLETYDKSGNRTSHNTSKGGKFEKRA